MDGGMKLSWMECYTMRLLKMIPDEVLSKPERPTPPKWAGVRACGRVFVMCAPAIYAFCAFVAWGFNPAEWGTWIRAVGASMLIILEFVIVGMALFYHRAMHEWIAKNGIDAVHALKKMVGVPSTKWEMEEFLDGVRIERD